MLDGPHRLGRDGVPPAGGSHPLGNKPLLALGRKPRSLAFPCD